MTAPCPFGPAFGFGLYVHWPYCARICPYCDFNVYAAKDRDPEPLARAILADLAGHADWLGSGGARPALTSLYFGGGTPSLLPVDLIADMIDAASAHFGLAEGCEITLEANPDDVLAGDVDGWRAAGINRLSIGVQSLDNAALAFLGRGHDADTARRAVEAGLAVFKAVSVDLIYARPGQSAESWRTELAEALALGAPHLSLYELTIEERTAFAQAVARGAWTPMSADDQADLYELTQEVAEAAGLPAYEISNHAASPAHRSIHNLTYWRGGDWIGIGPGAHGRLSRGVRRLATTAHRKPADYMQAVASAGRGWADAVELTPIETARELLAMGLRSSEGISRARLERLCGRLDPDRLGQLRADGFLAPDCDRLILTAQARLLADRIAADLSP